MTLAEAFTKRGSGQGDNEVSKWAGKFKYRENGGGLIQIIDPAWTKANIVQIPISKLPYWPKVFSGGKWKSMSALWAHRLMAPALIAAWAEVVRQGLAGRVRSYDGLWVPRHQLYDPSAPLSIHSWGLAVDLEARWNAYGAKPTLNAKVVEIFERHGFVWGGRWAVPDGMHFQFTDPIKNTRIPAHQDALYRK